MEQLLFLGDSITDCYHFFDTDNLGEGYVRMIAEHLGYGFDRVEVLNKGIDGFTLPSLLRLWKRDCVELHPDKITILIGINDVGVIKNTGADVGFALEEFKIGCETLIETIRMTCACPIILMEPFVFAYPAEYSSWKPLLAEINCILAGVAKRYGLTWIPLQEELDRAVERAGYEGITIDGIHLTTEGHQIIAEKWLNHMPAVSTVKAQTC